jgi:hypothetical protein
VIHHARAFYRDPAAGFDGLFLWDWLHGAFGPKIMPMDFDGVVERGGFFLVFETKDPGVPVPRGQVFTLDRLTDDYKWTVIFCAKRPKDIDGWIVLTRDGRTQHRGDARDLWRWCAGWYARVNSCRRTR